MPVAPHLPAPIGYGWVRFPPATFVRYLAWVLRGLGDPNGFVRYAAERDIAFDMAREHPAVIIVDSVEDL